MDGTVLKEGIVNRKWQSGAAGLVVALVLAAGCGRGDSAQTAEDQTARDLTLASPESTAMSGDQPAAGTSPAPAPAARAPTREPTPAASRPARSQPAAPARASQYTVAAGTRLHLAVRDTITSQSAKAGDAFVASLVDEVAVAGGQVALPAGSRVEGRIVEVKPAPDPYTPGVLRLALTGIVVGGRTYPFEATIDSLETVRQGRGVTAGDAAKVGAGAAAGAVVGRIVGKNATGTIIGGVVGAAVGAGVAHNTKDSDVVLPAGAHILATLADALTVAAQ